jgi:hypothetical protein
MDEDAREQQAVEALAARGQQIALDRAIRHDVGEHADDLDLDCGKCRDEAAALGMSHLMPRDPLPQRRMIEVYATGPADAMDSAKVYARDDMGVHVTDFIDVRLRRPIEQHGDRYIYQVTVMAMVLR